MSAAPSSYFGLIERIIREAPDVATGSRVLHEIARQFVPAELPVWKVLARLNWPKEVDGVRAAWIERARTCIPPEVSGIYFGLDGPNMPDGKGVELGCSTGHLPGWQSIDYVFNCETFCPDIPLPSLSALYTWFYAGGGYETFGAVDNMHIEYPICLGVTALVFRDALRGLDSFSLVGETTERCFALGFHDGDMLRLGRGTLDGFVNDATFDCW
jgi:hypothetical protein